MLQGVLFDIDGVLIDSEEAYFELVKKTLKHYGVKISQEEYIKRYMIELTCSAGVVKDYGIEATVEEVIARKAGLLDVRKFNLMPDARDLVDYFWRYHPIGAVTSAGRGECLEKLGRFDLVSSFDVIIAAEDVDNKKPHPEPYENGIRGLNVPARNVLAIEDNPSGVTSAKKAGCKVIAFPNCFTKDMDFRHADMAVRNLRQIMDEDLAYRLF